MLWLSTMALAAQPAPQVLIQTEAAPIEAPPEPKNGVSVGLSAGLATGFGPTLGIPFGKHVALQVTALPIVLPESGGGGSAGLRMQQFLGTNPRARVYLVEGAAVHGWSDAGAVWGAGAGAGIETRKDWSTGRSLWVDVTLTAFGGGDGMVAVLPLPQAGVAWIF